MKEYRVSRVGKTERSSNRKHIEKCKERVSMQEYSMNREIVSQSTCKESMDVIFENVFFFLLILFFSCPRVEGE